MGKRYSGTRISWNVYFSVRYVTFRSNYRNRRLFDRKSSLNPNSSSNQQDPNSVAKTIINKGKRLSMGELCEAINTDGGLNLPFGTACTGGLLSDHFGRWAGGFSHKYNTKLEPNGRS